jgi:hypothetical protein
MKIEHKTGDIIQAITFEQFISYGKSVTDNIVDDMPWSFEIFGLSVTHENDRLYLIEQLGNFTPKDVIVELYNEEYAILPRPNVSNEEIEKKLEQYDQCVFTYTYGEDDEGNEYTIDDLNHARKEYAKAIKELNR